MNFKQFAILTMSLIAAVSCAKQNEDFTIKELEIIQSSDTIMRVLTTKSETDMEVLRAKSSDLSCKSLVSEDFARLTELMIATVTDPSQDGVGIAGPQVGLNRRVIAVQRFDKEDYPFEIYANVKIVWASEELEAGQEGCLSVPDMNGEVMRSTSITIEYADLTALKEIENIDNLKEIPMVRETINDFTAVIFQHEIDHLEGILYIDRL